jgi:F-type H+-transporting ATPase subunit b
MAGLLGALGVDWKLLLAQGVNFFVVLLVLTIFVYRPLLRIMVERRKRIEEGLRGADEAEKRLQEIDTLKRETLTKAEKEALMLVSKAEEEARGRGSELVGAAERKASEVLAEAAKTAERKKQEELDVLLKEASAIVKAALVKTVELDPTKVDEALIRRATDAVRAESVL